MKYLSLIVLLLSGVLLIGIGTAIKYGKAYWLISGYNTLSKEKKQQVDIENLGEFSARLCFAIAGIIFLATVFLYWQLTFIAMGMFFLLVPVSIYAVIKSQSYDGNTRNPDGTMKTSSKIMLGAVIALLALTTVGVGVLMYFSSRPAEYLVGEDSFRISGMYGEEIRYENITSITLEEELPPIQMKTNGSDLGEIKKGYFRAEELGRIKLFLDASSRPPYIFAEAESGLRILNKKDAAETKELYRILLEAWRNRPAP